jgi:hypothetical protein
MRQNNIRRSSVTEGLSFLEIRWTAGDAEEIAAD